MTRLLINASTLQRFNALTIALVLSSCAGSSHPHVLRDTETVPSPRYLELYSEVRVGTLHFPAGVYILNAADKIGYYYRAPRKIAEHIPGGSAWHNGGIFVSKRDPEKLRGYIYRAGALAHVGNLSHTKHELHD